MKKKNRRKHLKQSVPVEPNVETDVAPIIDHHHIINQCDGGEDTVQNILRTKIKRHRGWHATFNHKTLKQAIALLQRLDRAKEAQSEQMVEQLPVS